MWILSTVLAFLAVLAPVQEDPLEATRAKIIIVDALPMEQMVRMAPTSIDGGPSTGDILNNHFFLGVRYFQQGMFSYSHTEFSYVIRRPYYLDINPRQAEYMSTSCYLRGMIYLHHSDGIGRYSLAKADFDAAIQWNPANYPAYLELSRVYTRVGLKDAAISLLRTVEKFDLEEKLAQEVQKELEMLTMPEAPDSEEVPAMPAETPAETKETEAR